MPHVSAQELEPRLNTTLLGLVNSVFALGSPYNGLFELLITDTEQLMWAKRLATLLLLHKGVKQARIARYLKMTRITVARLKRVYEGQKELVVRVTQALATNPHYQTLVTLVK